MNACKACGTPDVDDCLEVDGFCWLCSQENGVGEGVFGATHARELMEGVAKAVAVEADLTAATVKNRLRDGVKALKKEPQS